MFVQGEKRVELAVAGRALATSVTMMLRARIAPFFAVQADVLPVVSSRKVRSSRRCPYTFSRAEAVRFCEPWMEIGSQ